MAITTRESSGSVNRLPSLAGSRPSTRRYQLKWLVIWVFPAS
jgi:hypothetical protein